jgi:hypothetical protein
MNRVQAVRRARLGVAEKRAPMVAKTIQAPYCAEAVEATAKALQGLRSATACMAYLLQGEAK